MRDRLCGLIWKSKIPLKVKVFLWQMYHDKLQAAVTLKRRGWQGSPLCCVCNEHETVNHIFLSAAFHNTYGAVLEMLLGGMNSRRQNRISCMIGCQGGWESPKELC